MANVYRDYQLTAYSLGLSYTLIVLHLQTLVKNIIGDAHSQLAIASHRQSSPVLNIRLIQQSSPIQDMDTRAKIFLAVTGNK